MPETSHEFNSQNTKRPEPAREYPEYFDTHIFGGMVNYKIWMARKVTDDCYRLEYFKSDDMDSVLDARRGEKCGKVFPEFYTFKDAVSKLKEEEKGYLSSWGHKLHRRSDAHYTKHASEAGVALMDRAEPDKPKGNMAPGNW